MNTMKLLLAIATFFLSTVSTPRVALAHGEDDPLLLMGVVDQLEVRDADDGNVTAWDFHGWLGKDLDKLWLSAEGEREGGETEHSEVQLRFSRAVSTYWDFQLGLRHDFEPSPSRDWLAFGFNGLAPYFFDINASFYIGESGQTALRFEAEYELLLTQRLILSPEIEINLHGEDDAAVGTGAGLSDLELGLRLRYEIRREFAPYIGISWERRFGDTADYARSAGAATSDTQWLLGIRAWF